MRLACRYSLIACFSSSARRSKAGRRLRVRGIGQQPRESLLGVFEGLRGDRKPLGARRRQSLFEFQQGCFDHAHQPARPGVFGKRQGGHAAQEGLLELDIDAVGGEVELFPQDDRVVRVFEDLVEVLLAQVLEDGLDRQAADELALEAELDQVLGLDMLEDVDVLPGAGDARAEADPLPGHPPPDHRDQLREGPAHDEQDVLGVDGLPLALSGFAEAFDLLHHRDRVVGDLEIDVGLFHGFEQRALHPGARDVGPDQIAGGGDLVDLVDVDDAVLGQLDVLVRLPHQVPDQVLHVPADVARLAELGGVALDEGDPDLVGDELDDVRLAHPGGADHQHVVLDAAGHALQGVAALPGPPDAVEVGADLGRQDRLGLILPHHELVEVGDQLLGLEVEVDGFLFARGRLGLVRACLLGHRHRRHDLDVAAEFLGQKLADFLLELLGVGDFFVVHAHRGQV